MAFSSLFSMFSMFSKDIGIDLGTANTLVFMRGKGIVMREPSVVAVDARTDEVLAVGKQAKEMLGRTPGSIVAVRPLKDGVIADFDNMQTMLLEILRTRLGAHLKGADIVLSVPTDITEVEKKAFYDIFAKTKIKARSILLCEKSLADALGLGLDISQPTGIMVVDMGADTTEISVISLGGLVLSNLIPFGGNKLDEAIVTHLKRKFNLVIGKKTAKELKESIGSALNEKKEKMTVVGRDVVSGLPIEMEVSSEIIYEGIRDDLTNISNSIRLILEKVPPELAKDIVRDGEGATKLIELCIEKISVRRVSCIVTFLNQIRICELVIHTDYSFILRQRHVPLGNAPLRFLKLPIQTPNKRSV